MPRIPSAFEYGYDAVVNAQEQYERDAEYERITLERRMPRKPRKEKRINGAYYEPEKAEYRPGWIIELGKWFAVQGFHAGKWLAKLIFEKIKQLREEKEVKVQEMKPTGVPIRNYLGESRQ